MSKKYKPSNIVSVLEKNGAVKDTTITVQNPMIESVSGGQINVFAVKDNRPRIMFILEELSPNEQTPDVKNVVHMLRWNCDPRTAHNIALDGCSGTRNAELQEIAALEASSAAGKGSVK